MFDFALDSAGTRTLSPVVTGITFTGFTDVPATIDNLSGVPAAITITMTFLRRE
jgi:hypothetical protein